MKKNKTIAYMLAATLLVGGTFLGTKALFTDTDDMTTDLVITTGKVDVEVSEGKWEKNGVESETGKFGLIVPGDIFTKEVTITNNSTVDTKITTDMEFIKDTEAGNELQAALKDKFVAMNETITLEDGTQLDGSDFDTSVEGLGSGESLTVKIEAKVGTHLNTSGLTQEEMNKIDNKYQEYVLDFENGQMQYVINAEQANVPNK